MSVPRADYDPRKIFLISCPSLPFFKHRRAIGVYTAGALFALAYAMFFDACALSSHAKPPKDAPQDTVPVHVTFVDWLPGIFTTLGLLIINLIDKERLLAEGSYGGEPSIIWRARLFLFIGFALMAGGLAGSVSLLVLKYIVTHPPLEPRYQYYGYANVAQNVSLMLSAVVLWLAQHASSDFELPTPARLVFTFGKLDGKYNGVFPVIWKTVPFPPGNSPPLPLIYVHNLTFSHPVVKDDVITDFGQETSLLRNDEEKYSFSTPTDGQRGLMSAVNQTGKDEMITLGFISSPIPTETPSPMFYYEHLGDGSVLAINDFGPKLYAYFSLTYSEEQIIRGKAETEFIWEHDLTTLPLVSNWMLKFDPTKLQYSL
ncbi:hypothetical protein FRC17_002994, partial [Serendipita sp. 399]